MRRRQILTVLAAALGGCNGQGAPTPTNEGVTAAPVPSSEQRATPAAVCPELPPHAEVYVCSATVDDDRRGLLVRPEALAGDVFEFTLTNELEVGFVTGDDWWTLAHRGPAGWETRRQGEETSPRAVPGGESLRWWLDTAPATTAETGRQPGPRRLRLPLETGRYAFAVAGYITGGELTALVAPFVVS